VGRPRSRQTRGQVCPPQRQRHERLADRLDELRPYYEEAQELCGLGPFEYGAAHWSTDAHKPFELGGNGLTSGVYQFGYAERVTRELADELHATEPISVAASTSVVELVVDSAARQVGAVRAFDPSGRIIEMKPRVVILACGAVENARLLLLAGLGRNDGSEWLGRCFVEHARDSHPPLAGALCQSGVLRPSHLAGRFSRRRPPGVGGRPTGYVRAAERRDDVGPSIPEPYTAARRPHPRTVRRVMGVAPDDRYGWSRVDSPAKAFDRFDIVLNLEQRPRPQNTRAEQPHRPVRKPTAATAAALDRGRAAGR
jgi:hypothetical protein